MPAVSASAPSAMPLTAAPTWAASELADTTVARSAAPVARWTMP